MNLEPLLSDDEKLVRDSARRFAERHGGTARTRKLRDAVTGYDAEETPSHHGPDRHEYLVARTVLLQDGLVKSRVALHAIDLYPRVAPPLFALQDDPFQADGGVRLMQGRLGRALFTPAAKRHFHPQGLLGVFSAAAAAGKPRCWERSSIPRPPAFRCAWGIPTVSRR